MQTEPATQRNAWIAPPEERFSNRGRFGAGPPDARGFIGRAEILQACALPRSGRIVSCAAEDGAPGPTLESAAPPAPLVGRGVLLDFCRAARRSWLPPETALTAADLDTCAERLGVAIESGDLLLVRTGMLERFRSEAGLHRYARSPGPGLSPSCARWLYEREISLVAADTPWVEVCSDPASGAAPLRRVAGDATGIVFGRHFDLDALARSCAAERSHAFLLMAPAPGTKGETRPVAVL